MKKPQDPQVQCNWCQAEGPQRRVAVRLSQDQAGRGADAQGEFFHACEAGHQARCLAHSWLWFLPLAMHWNLLGNTWKTGCPVTLSSQEMLVQWVGGRRKRSAVFQALQVILMHSWGWEPLSVSSIHIVNGWKMDEQILLKLMGTILLKAIWCTAGYKF